MVVLVWLPYFRLGLRLKLDAVTVTEMVSALMDKLMTPLGDCLNVEAAEKIVELRADDELQERIHELGQKSQDGELSNAEREEYETIVRYTNLISILQSKARKLLRSS